MVGERKSLTFRKGYFLESYEISKELSKHLSKLLRHRFGRGPELCHVFIKYHFIVFYIKGFVSAIEEVLIKEEQLDTVSHSRYTVIQSLLPELRGIIELMTGDEVEEFYQDWNIENNTGMIVATLKAKQVESISTHFQSREQMIEEIDRISGIIQKQPNKTEVYQITPEVYVSTRDGILVLIEKALITKGFEKPLILTKTELEKAYFHHNSNFNQIFQREINDIFIAWDFKNDKALTVFFLNKENIITR